MSCLQNIERGRSRKPPRIVAYGPEGIGKSTFGSQAPNPIFISTEDGLGELDVARFPLARTLDGVLQPLAALANEEHPFDTVVIDTADWLERLIWDRACRDAAVQSIERIDGGYGKGYVRALDYWHDILHRLDVLRDHHNMVVIVLAHAKVERFEDPEAPAYDRYVPRLHKLASALLVEWADAVLFATRKVRTQAEDAGFGRHRSIAHAVGRDGGERILRVVGGPSCVAKNRYGLVSDLPLAWAAFEAALSSQPQ